MSRTLRAFVAAGLALSVSVGACRAAARAHATLERSTPASGASMSAPPQQVDLYFSEALADPGGASFAVVLDGNGATVSAAAHADPADARHLIVPLNGTLDDGSYTVFWKSASASDGGTTLGDFSFSVGAVAASPQPATGGQVPVPDTVRSRALSADGGSSAGAWLTGGAIGLVIGAAVAVGVLDLRARRAPAATQFRPPRRKR